MTVGNIIMVTVLLWVQIRGVSFDMISPQVAKEVGGRLGVVEEVEWKKRKDDINFFMQVRVALPISKSLKREGFIVGRMESGIGWTLSTRDYLFFAIIVGY